MWSKLWLFDWGLWRRNKRLNGKMLVKKRKRFEEKFNMLKNEQLEGESWVQSFCKTWGFQLWCFFREFTQKYRYKLKEFCRHGEAASVEPTLVEAERRHMWEVLAPFAQKDRWNFNESSFFAFAPLDCGLAFRQMSGKKRSKFCISIGFACNVDESEKMPPVLIGKYKRPWCFKEISPDDQGFYYWNNKTAWMTSGIFEEWVPVICTMKLSNKL